MMGAKFRFQGAIPASKSMMNRALLVQSYEPALKIQGNSNCDDVRHMKMAVSSFIQKKEMNCGEAGTVIRFMSLRASREKGLFRLGGSPRLLSRPQDDLVYILDQLGVSCQLLPNQILIQSEGWKKPLLPLRIHRQSSSQFATGLLLNSWQLPFDLEFEMKPGVSEGYWQMSVEMARHFGMTIEAKNDLWRIPSGQKVENLQIIVEPDYSSAFVIAAAGTLAGESIIENATEKSLQPDFQFISILKKMGAIIQQQGSSLAVRKPVELKAIDINLQSSPDLFPVLAVLCAFAKGESWLRGAPHLVHKESDRIAKTTELLRLAGFICSSKADGLHIVGHGAKYRPVAFQFDPDQDHRMAMAAGLLKMMGFEVSIQNPQVVSKSFPEFWQALGVKP
jgi:3-phosphoshikimate 1-carboxyvinyltransferase